MKSRCLFVLFMALVFAPSISAQASSAASLPGDLTRQFEQAMQGAVPTALGYAQSLFRALAAVEVAWVALLLLLEKADLQGWTAGLLRRMLILNLFWWVLLNGNAFGNHVITMFRTIGLNVSGLPSGPASGYSPGTVFLRGVELANQMGDAAMNTGWFTNPAGAFGLTICALLLFGGFCLITIHYIMTLVESFITVGAGVVFLGFGGNSVTRPYVERYFGLAVGVGVKLMVLLILIGIGMGLTNTWIAMANALPGDPYPFRTSLDLVGGALVFGAVCWGVPKFAASLLSGSPNFSGNDIIGMAFQTASAATMVGGLTATAVKGMSAGGVSLLSAAANVGGGGDRSGSGRGGSGSGGGGSSGASSASSVSGGSREAAGPTSYSPLQAAPPGSNNVQGASGPQSSTPSGFSGASSASSEGKNSSSTNPGAPAENAAARPPGQVSPPATNPATNPAISLLAAVGKGAEAVERGMAGASNLLQRAKRAMPPDGGGGGSPPHLGFGQD
jgi:type IV secretion system protein TrbL